MTKKLNIDIIAKDKSQQAFKKVQNSTEKTKQSILSLKNALVALGTGAAIKSIISTTARFEDLRTSLASVTGSVEQGAEAFDFVSKFATKTQFSVEDLSRTFIKLKAAGITPTEELLNVFTNTAAITTDQIGSLEAVTDLFARTVSGGLGLEEIQRLGDRGVPILRLLEKELGITRGQISEFGKTAEGAKKITDAFAKGIQEEFGDATSNLVNNLSTKFSNLQIALSNNADAFGQGLSPAIKEATQEITDLIVENQKLVESLGRDLGDALSFVLKSVLSLVKGYQDLNVAIQKVTDSGTTLFNILTGNNTFRLLNETIEETEVVLDSTTEKMKLFRDAEIESRKAIAGTTDEIEKQKEAYKSKVDVSQIVADAELAIAKEAHKKNLEELKSFDGEMRRRDIANTNFSKNEAKRKVEIERQAQGQILDAVGDGLSKVSGLNKDAFRAYQAFQIGMATLNTFRAASNALQQYPFPLNIGVAAAETARGLATVAQIRATPAPRISGGRVNEGQPYMVGEAGREMFVPQSSGTIVPNNQLGSPNVNITIMANDTEGFDDLLLKRRSTIVNVINDALNSQGKEALV